MHRNWSKELERERPSNLTLGTIWQPVHEEPLESRIVTVTIGLLLGVLIYGVAVLW